MRFFRRTYFEHTDEALMQAIARRDEGAFAELYDRYSPRMYRFFMRMLWQDAAKAEDFTQELFLKILEKNHQYDPKRKFKTWIYTVAGNLCKNEYRRNRPAGLESEREETWEDDLPEKLDARLFAQHLRIILEQLSPVHRQCIVLRYQEELSISEIAEIIDSPEGTVKSRLHHALRQMATQMECWKTT